MIPEDVCQYQLRRIGPPATCNGVLDVMRLKVGSTRFGRGQNNDFYLDSAKLKNFISRHHAEIVGRQNENGEIEFTLYDRGLNGSFVNDTRTKSSHVLELGDKVTFGHTNGYKMKPGHYAVQTDSEFQFIFETVPNLSSTNICSERGLSSLDSFGREEAGEASSDKLETASQDRSCLSSNIPNLQTDAQNGTQKAVRNSKDDIVYCSDEEEAKELKITHSGRDKVKSVNNASLSETLPAESERSPSPEITTQKTPILDSKKSEENVGREIFPPEKKSKKGKKTSHDQYAFSDESSSEAIPRGKKAVDLTKLKSTTTSKESLKAANSKKATQTASTKRKKSTTGQSKPRKKKKSGRKPNTDSSGEEEDEELEDGVEWYTEDKCTAFDCKKPKGKRIKWVQCDDCDKWYHTDCVGTSYDIVKDRDTNFSCGCV